MIDFNRYRRKSWSAKWKWVLSSTRWTMDSIYEKPLLSACTHCWILAWIGWMCLNSSITWSWDWKVNNKLSLLLRSLFRLINFVKCLDHYDIKMLTYLMVVRLASLCPTAVLQRLDRLVEPLRSTCTTKVKANAVKQEYEKQDELKVPPISPRLLWTDEWNWLWKFLLSVINLAIRHACCGRSAGYPGFWKKSSAEWICAPHPLISRSTGGLSLVSHQILFLIIYLIVICYVS